MPIVPFISNIKDVIFWSSNMWSWLINILLLFLNHDLKALRLYLISNLSGQIPDSPKMARSSYQKSWFWYHFWKWPDLLDTIIYHYHHFRMLMDQGWVACYSFLLCVEKSSGLLAFWLHLASILLLLLLLLLLLMLSLLQLILLCCKEFCSESRALKDKLTFILG